VGPDRNFAAMSSFLTPLATAYKWAALGRSALYRRRLLSPRKLNRPVISIGNLSTGGAGKTPLVMLLAKLAQKRGLKPAILTRGYGRRRGARLIAVAPAESRSPSPRETGDEPAILAGALPDVPIVICASRYEAGTYAEREFQVDVHVLDDGFQHLQLARNVDVVALDATQEFSDRGVLPAGRLREPCSALGRAQVVVLTRVELADADRLEKSARRVNSSAQFFRSRLRLTSLLNVASGERVAVESFHAEPVFAFCGIGNSMAFFSYLERWGFRIVGRHNFSDHHIYSLADETFLVRKAQESEASALIMTEKDLMNLPPGWKPAVDTYACTIEVDIENAAEFEAAVFSGLSGP
jgi:tetraacyldisaccharide 4'-kinase